MDMGYDDSNYFFSKNLVVFNYLLDTVHKIDFEGRFLYKIHHAGPVWAQPQLSESNPRTLLWTTHQRHDRNAFLKDISLWGFKQDFF